MSRILESLRAANHHDFVFDDGTKVGFHYPDVADFIVEVGEIPLPALGVATPEDVTEEKAMEIIGRDPDAFGKQLQIQRKVAAAMLDTVNGEPIDADDDRDAIVGELGMEKRTILFLIATRQLDPDAPKADHGEAADRGEV